MKKLFLFTLAALLLTSCSTTSLYYWGGTQKQTTTYENLAYMDYKKQSPEAICRLIVAYNDMVTNPSKEGTRHVPAPGICAEYGYLLMQPETAAAFTDYATVAQKKAFQESDYAGYFPGLGKDMFQKEMEYYPESIPFIEPLLKKLAR
ncbi:MAG: DUF4810 domain-containing protein [Bacteroidaceae bacterium]|nr:DUF4810 domain-containing protein [Bacteroidaceae bacterium]